MPETRYTYFFKFASRLTKYLLIALFSFSVSLILAYTLGANQIVTMLLSEVVPLLLRSAIVIGCVMAAATIVESLRS